MNAGPEAQPSNSRHPLARSLDDPWTWSAPGPLSAPDAELPHVLLVVDQLPQALGGGERVVLRLAELLPRYGFRASVLTFAMHPASSALVASLPFPVYLLPLARTWDLTALRAARTLTRFLHQQDVQIVQTFFESSDLWAGAVTRVMSPARLIWSRRDMGILRTAKHRLAYRLMSSMPDMIFAVSGRVRQHCIDEDGARSEKVRIIYSGLDVPVRNTRPTDAHRPIHVTTVGNVRHVKGHDVFVRAAALVLAQFPATVFSIAGEVMEPAYQAELDLLVDTLGIADRFHFLGSIRQVRQHLEQADLFVLPSRSEGFSNAILEAMACSLPVIATDVGGNAEAVNEAITGFIVASEDAQALAERILELVADLPKARSMGEAARALAERKFSTASMMEQVADAYRSLSGRR